MEITVRAPGILSYGNQCVRCGLGKSGIRTNKREGDGATPAGHFALRRILYRADRLDRPASGLPTAPIGQADGWCDDPDDPNYNRPVALPYAGHHETLWRGDRLYDVIVVLGHNDQPPIKGLGSAVFLHIAANDYAPTEGCIALAQDDLCTLVKTAGLDAMLVIES
jgi:L,D-peptidoglycan transpeptidase YkuD (ErfK/YbiS/YcfS/YnhG family)